MMQSKFLGRSRQINFIGSSLIFLLACSMCTTSSLGQEAKSYSITWKATCAFAKAWDPEIIGGTMHINATVNGSWEGSAEVVFVRNEYGTYDEEVSTLQYDGYHDYQVDVSDRWYYPKCDEWISDSGHQTFSGVTPFAGSWDDQIKNRLITWAWYVRGHVQQSNSMKDPFSLKVGYSCNPKLFSAIATYRSWGERGGNCFNPEPFKSDDLTTGEFPLGNGLMFNNTEDDLTPVDSEGHVFTKTADGIDYFWDQPIVTHWEIRVESSCYDWHLDVVPQFQDLGYYADNCYDHTPDPDGDGKCGLNLGNFGCHITCIAMALTYAGYPTDVGALHEFIVEPFPDNPELKGKSLFTNSGQFDGVSTVELFTNNEATYHFVGIYSEDQPELADDLLDKIVHDDGYPAIVGVNIGARDPNLPGHYVVVTGRDCENWTINDPVVSGNDYLDEYGDYVLVGYIGPVASGITTGSIAEAEPDLSRLIILADDNVEINVVDQEGNRTGFNSDQYGVDLGIPNSESAYLGLQNDDTKEWLPVGLKIVVIRQPTAQGYEIELGGIDEGAYNVNIHSFDRDGRWKVPIEIEGLAGTGSLENLKVEFDPTPGVPVVVNQVDPLIEGIPVEGVEGWFYSEWFGYYSTAFAPWLYHSEHGFIHRFPDSSNASLFIFDNAMGAWWWTNESVYPFIYVFDPPLDLGGTNIGSEWLFYFEGSSGPRAFGVVTGADAGAFLFFGP